MSAKVHLHMHVSDLAKSQEFYGTFFGGRAGEGEAGLREVLAGMGAGQPGALHGPSGGRGGREPRRRPGDSPATVTAHLARVKAAGLPVREEMGVNCCHANQDKFWVQDPDGSSGRSTTSTTISRTRRRRDRPEASPAGEGRLLLRLVTARARRQEEPTMADQDIKQMVKDQYGKAALAVSTGDSSCCAGSACCGSDSSQAADPITSNLYSDSGDGGAPGRGGRRLPRLRQPDGPGRARPGRRCWTWARAAASTCCSRPGAWDRPARPTAST